MIKSSCWQIDRDKKKKKKIAIDRPRFNLLKMKLSTFLIVILFTVGVYSVRLQLSHLKAFPTLFAERADKITHARGKSKELFTCF
jgi:hypothetical protein